MPLTSSFAQCLGPAVPAGRDRACWAALGGGPALQAQAASWFFLGPCPCSTACVPMHPWGSFEPPPSCIIRLVSFKSGCICTKSWDESEGCRLPPQGWKSPRCQRATSLHAQIPTSELDFLQSQQREAGTACVNIHFILTKSPKIVQLSRTLQEPISRFSLERSAGWWDHL